ncbi:STE24 endopeptidase [Inhella inkyongensis]|uniref:STE24 endopeptidase n=1 Tax=Inhella inkyongensis TaxID=392593 RepID=A0A840S5Y5_9BURK|nr:M48 family metallopeptidase [Inhella inkyongensis]MBB5203899.1 STE24 endopeptidase [Inhella inkyongensis]
MSSQIVTLIFAAALLASTLLKLWLTTRQIRHVAQHRAQVPPAFAAHVSLAAHQKAADYTLAKGRLQMLMQVLSAAVLVGWTLMGGLEWLNQSLYAAIGREAWGGYAYPIALLLAFNLIGSLIDLPFELYSTFVLEARFGFNRTDWKTFLTDQIKGLVLLLVLGIPLIWALLALMRGSGPQWWIWTWALWFGFSLSMMLIYPLVIAPLFNKFTPLTDGALKDRVEALFARAGFAAKGLFVMDAGRRSAHGNAYFTGLGAAKRVVLFDTLLERLDPPEVEAVLAHELGHFKLRHVPKRLALMAFLSLAGFALLGWLAQQPAFYLGLGVRPNLLGDNEALALLLFGMTLPVFSILLTPLMAQGSRKHEFEADAYACQHSEGRALASALLKLHEDNASTLTPDPLVARWTYSHPPAAERLPAILAQARP